MKISRNFCMIYRKRSFVSKVWKNEKFSPSKLFLQINSLVIYLVKPLLSRNFCQKCVRENSLNFHTVVSVLIANLCSMKIYHFSCHSYFTWNQFLRNQGGKFLKSFLGIEMKCKSFWDCWRTVFYFLISLSNSLLKRDFISRTGNENDMCWNFSSKQILHDIKMLF